MLKVEFEEYSESDKDLNSDFNPQNVSYKKLSENQSKRNYHRAKRFREEKDNSIEHPRNFEIRHSTPVRDILDPSDCINDSPAHCFDEKSVSREHPIAYRGCCGGFSHPRSQLIFSLNPSSQLIFFIKFYPS